MNDLRISFVVIGLNEASHLSSAFAQLAKQGMARDEMEIIYVDSSSDDGSPEIARDAGVDRLLSIPREEASAPRARNAGLASVRAPFVQFVDGDTSLAPDWCTRGLRALAENEDVVGVEGELREARPRANLYHAVCDFDWPTASGEVDYVGGNALYRVAGLREVGAFDPDMRFGEEPELGVRLRAGGWRMLHLEDRMASHDIDIRSFFEYLQHAYKTGVSCALVVRATGGMRSGYWANRLRRTLSHGLVIALPAGIGLALLPVAPMTAALVAAAGPLAILLLALRKARATRRQGVALGLSLAHGLHTYVSKLARVLGILSVMLGSRPVGAPRRAPLGH